MSTTLAEAPKATETAKPTPVELPPDQEAIVASLLRPQVTGQPNVKPKVEAVKEEPKKEEPKAEVVKDVPDKEKNWAELRTAREADKKRADELEARLKTLTEEHETFKKNPLPKEFEERLTKAEQERAHYQQELRAAALQRDPEFQQKYNAPIKTAIDRMAQAFLAAGADKNEVSAAVAQWNEEKFGEWMEGMPVAQKLQAQSAYMRAVELDNQRQAELRNADKGWEELQKQRQDNEERGRKAYLDTLRADKRAVLDAMLEKEGIFKGDPKLQEETEALIDRLAGLNGDKMSPRQIIEMTANSHVLARHFQKVDKERTELTVKVEELSKKLDEQNEFIKTLSNSSPTPGPTGSKPAGTVDDAFLNSLLHPKVKV